MIQALFTSWFGIFSLFYPPCTLLPGWSSDLLLNPLKSMPKTCMLSSATKANFLILFFRAPSQIYVSLLSLPHSALLTHTELSPTFPPRPPCHMLPLLSLPSPIQPQLCSHFLYGTFSWFIDSMLAPPHSTLLFISCCQILTHSQFISCWIICSLHWWQKIN